MKNGSGASGEASPSAENGIGESMFTDWRIDGGIDFGEGGGDENGLAGDCL
jgi:hypothetical protein